MIAGGVVVGLTVVGGVGPANGGGLAQASDEADVACPAFPNWTPPVDWTEKSDAEIAQEVALRRVSELDYLAWTVLGDRFVDSWGVSAIYGADAARVTIGVFELKEAEVDSLTERLTERLQGVIDFPLYVVNRPFSRQQVNELRAKANAAWRLPGGWAMNNLVYYGSGLVLLQASPECLDIARSAVISTTGQEPIVGDELKALLATPAPPPGFLYTEAWNPPSGHPEVALQSSEVLLLVGESNSPTLEPATATVKPEPATVKATTAKVKAAAVKKHVKASSHPKVRVKVSVPGVERPEGRITISWGKSRKTVSLKANAKGSITVKLPKMQKGKYLLTARFVPNDADMARARSKRIALRIV
jgi:hypothetical protein